MLNQREELEFFKREIDLVRYAAAIGYEIERGSSSRSSIAMRHPNGDKIIIARAQEGHWVYFSVHDDQDNGTIIDFIQSRRRISLGEVRKDLRQWTGSSSFPPLSLAASDMGLPSLRRSLPKDLGQVRARFEAMQPIAGHHEYLEGARLIPSEVLGHPRFRGCIRVDARGNAVFPHRNEDGVCGYELKNRGFTRFAAGGEKGLWLSNTTPDDTALVITESAIDALSHFALRRPAAYRYASSAGTLNPAQPGLIRQAAADLPTGASVIIATDNDAGGDKLANTLRSILRPLVPQLRLVEDRPDIQGADWNDILRRSGKVRTSAE